MARSALSTNRGAIGKGPITSHQAVPALSVAVASAMAMLPIVSAYGWWPDMGLLMLLAWRLLRADVWPAWVAAPLGLWSDLVTGAPIGFAVALWTMLMLAMDVIDRRTMWRDYWVEWAIAAGLLVLAEFAQWHVATLAGAPVPLAAVAPAMLVAALCFPIAGFLVFRLDRWRMGT